MSQGIAPTLIIIRVALGISSENTSGTVASTRIKWVAHRVEETGTSATNYTDGLITTTDVEGMKESELASVKHEYETDAKLFGFGPTHRAEGISSSV